MTVLKVAIGQFPVSASIERNVGWITRRMHEAARQGVRVAHFPEGARSAIGTEYATLKPAATLTYPGVLISALSLGRLIV